MYPLLHGVVQLVEDAALLHLAGLLLLIPAQAPVHEGDQRDTQGQVEKEDRGTQSGVGGQRGMRGPPD